MIQPSAPGTAEGSVPRSAGGAGLSTFLLTDIEGSTRLWEDQAAAMSVALATHDRLVRVAIDAAGGALVKTMGDGMLAVFDDPVAALTAALEAQRALRDADWGSTGPLRVRMALHAGAAESRDGDYFGPALNRDARILAIGHGGQILLSAVTAALAREGLPSTVQLVDLGSHRLRDLDRPEQVFQVAVDDLPREFPPLRSLSTGRSNLPIQLTSFIGREKEIADVGALVARARFVTLIGTGGTGKTRLMLETAGRVADRFADGAWLAELAPLRESNQIAPEIARALGVPEVAGKPAIEAATEFLASKELLLLLDNAEHLVDGVADIAGRLLAAAPRLRVVTTSREALAVPGEVIFQVPSLTCPAFGDHAPGSEAWTRVDPEAAKQTEAVRLFSDRAASVLPAFVVTNENAVAVAEICRRLDGIPLALELAAARVSAMSPEEIAAGLGDRFRLLAGGRRTAVPRQQTLQALIDWSWGLLSEDDRRLLRRLSVFSGGWTARAAAAVVADDPTDAGKDRVNDRDIGLIVDGLTRLVDRSLVVVDRGATTRYRLLETIRQYARERLVEAGDAEALADRHFRFFGGFAEAASSELRGAAMAEWLDRLDMEAENLGTALEWGLEAAPEAALRMCDAMYRYWRVRVAAPDAEARILRAVQIAREIAAGPPEPTSAQLALAGRFLGHASELWGMTGRVAEVADWARDALIFARASNDRSAVIGALGGSVYALAFTGRFEELRPLGEEAIRLASAAGEWDEVAAGAGIGAAGALRLDPEASEGMMAVADAAASRTRNPLAIGMVALGHGRIAGAMGRTDEARAQIEVAINRFAELGDERLGLAARSDLGHALRRGGRFDEALAIYRETIGGWVRLGNRGAVANILEQAAFIGIERGDASRAARLIGAAESLRERASSPMSTDELAEYGSFVERLRRERAEVPIDAEWAAGRAMSMEEAVGFLATQAASRIAR
jgi:predicted ATPase/class 3 adenylate cyclase